MPRVATVNWATTTAQVPGTFTPSAMFKVSLGPVSVVVDSSPALLVLPASMAGGIYEASVVALDSEGIERGSPAVFSATVPEPTVAINVPINATAVVVLS